MKLEKWYKYKIESNTEDPPEKVWEEVQNALDIDLVWQRVDQELQPAAKKVSRTWIAVAASLLLLMAALGTLWYQAGILRKPGKEDAVTAVERPAIQRLPAITGQQQPLITASQPFLPITHRLKQRLLYKDKNTAMGLPEDSPAGLTIPAMQPMTGAVAVSAMPDFFTAADSQMNDYPIDHDVRLISEDALDDIRNHEAMGQQGTYFGLSMQFANTWLRNEKTAAGLQNTSLVDTRPSFGKSFGVVVGQQLSKKVDLKLGLNIISEKSQAYNEYLHGQFVSTRIDMNYTKLVLTASYRFGPHSPHRAVAGLYAAYLVDASQFVHGMDESVTRDYNKTDFGLVAGYEYVYQLGDRVQLGTGVYANYGLQNVFAGNDQLPAYLNRTNLLSLHAGISLGYAFRQ